MFYSISHIIAILFFFLISITIFVCFCNQYFERETLFLITLVSPLIDLDDILISYDDSKSTFSYLELLNGSALETFTTIWSSVVEVLRGLGALVTILVSLYVSKCFNALQICPLKHRRNLEISFTIFPESLKLSIIFLSSF